VQEASENVPEDLNVQLQTHLNKLIGVVKSIKDSVKEQLEQLPEIADDLKDQEVVDLSMVDDYIPDANEVDMQIEEAINFLEPLADALAVEGSTTAAPASS